MAPNFQEVLWRTTNTSGDSRSVSTAEFTQSGRSTEFRSAAPASRRGKRIAIHPIVTRPAVNRLRSKARPRRSPVAGLCQFTCAAAVDPGPRLLFGSMYSEALNTSQYEDRITQLALDLRWRWNHSTDELWRDLEQSYGTGHAIPGVVLQTASRERLDRLLAEPQGSRPRGRDSEWAAGSGNIFRLVSANESGGGSC